MAKKRKPRTFMEYLTIAKGVGQLGGDESFIWLMERFTNQTFFAKGSPEQNKIDQMTDLFFEDIKMFVNSRLAELMAKADYPLVEQETMLRASYPTGLETEHEAVKQTGPNRPDYHDGVYKSDFNDPFGDDEPKSVLKSKFRK